MHKEGQGRLDIELSLKDNFLNCTITDNGVGREKAEEMKSKTAEKEKSMGLKITTARLALLNREKGLHTSYEIEDLYAVSGGKNENARPDDPRLNDLVAQAVGRGNASGTKVTIKISFKESVEEPV